MTIDPEKTSSSYTFTQQDLEKLPDPLTDTTNDLVNNLMPGASDSHDNFLAVRGSNLSNLGGHATAFGPSRATIWAKRCAIWSSASVQATRSIVPLLQRIIGCSKRPSSPSVSPSAEPLEQSRPKFAG